MDSPLSLFLVVASPTSLPNLFLGPNSTPTHTHPTSPLDDRAVSPTPERVRVVLTHEGDLADGPVIVQPFRHQVGGHTAVVTVPGSPFVAKPMDPKKREHAFYLRAPKALGGFVPAFYGVRSAEFGAVVTGEPDRREHASIDDESGPVVTTDDTLAAGRRGLTFSEGPECTRRPQPVMKSAPLASLPNPWSLTMYQKALDKTADSSGTTDFILLENLTAKFKRPCTVRASWTSKLANGRTPMMPLPKSEPAPRPSVARQRRTYLVSGCAGCKSTPSPMVDTCGRTSTTVGSLHPQRSQTRSLAFFRSTWTNL
eukprot:m.386422 g.386422  ORF g.386422 m.386422 type:complete len:312 (+) comp28281_c0_seq16:462-1397(+)